MTAEGAAALWGATVDRLLSHRENAVYRVTLPDGTPAALRLHRAGYQGAAAIRSELWWCAALAAQGVRVPAALPALSGALLQTLETGQHASVIAWAKGEPLGATGQPFAAPLPRVLDLHHALGRLLRQMHQTTDRLTLPADFTRPRWDRAGLLGEAPLWGRFWDHPEAAPDQRHALLRAREVLLERLDPQETLGPIHADVLRENVLVGPDGLTLIDFDDSGIGYRLYDLGTVLSQNLNEPAYPAIREALMDGYGTTDRAAVEAFTLMRCCASVGWAMTRLAPGHPVHASHLARAMDCAARTA